MNLTCVELSVQYIVIQQIHNSWHANHPQTTDEKYYCGKWDFLYLFASMYTVCNVVHRPLWITDTLHKPSQWNAQLQSKMMQQNCYRTGRLLLLSYTLQLAYSVWHPLPHLFT